MKAVWKGQTLAEADKDELIYIEGNWYFPARSLRRQYFQPSDMRTTCYWKGDASYYDIAVSGEVNEGAAWFYPKLKEGAAKKVQQDFTNYVAFWRGVEVK